MDSQTDYPFSTQTNVGVGLVWAENTELLYKIQMCSGVQGSECGQRQTKVWIHVGGVVIQTMTARHMHKKCWGCVMGI